MKAEILALMAPVQRLVWTVTCLVSLSVNAHDLPLETLNVPDGFSIKVYAELLNPRQLALSPEGVVYAGSRRAGNLYAVIDRDGDQVAEEVITIDQDLIMPSGIALRDDDLYVAALDRILVYRGIAGRLASPPAEPEIVYDALPDKRHHGWKYLKFGPDGFLYFNIGAPCNVCLMENPWFASIMRLDLTATPIAPELYAAGIRNSVGFDWHPDSGELWFTDNGRDFLGDEVPPCELNRVKRQGEHFGFPFRHGRDVDEPEFGPPTMPVTAPVTELGAHVAPLGMAFYEGDTFPAAYRGKIFIAEHGSWNRSVEAGHVGYRITMVDPVSGEYSNFIDGWLQNNVGWGRPADILPMPDGSLLVADDTGNVIYRISYDHPQTSQ